MGDESKKLIRKEDAIYVDNDDTADMYGVDYGDNGGWVDGNAIFAIDGMNFYGDALDLLGSGNAERMTVYCVFCGYNGAEYVSALNDVCEGDWMMWQQTGWNAYFAEYEDALAAVEILNSVIE